MADTISWTVNAVASSGPAIRASGATIVDAISSASVPLPASTGTATAVDVNLQLELATRFRFLAVTCPNTKGEVEISVGTAAAKKTVKLYGPFVLHHDAIALFTSDLSTLKVTNTSNAATELSILIGYQFAP